MSIFDDARAGVLIGAKLSKRLREDSSLLNSQDRSNGWTLLATAVASGFPEEVKQLLERGAEANLRCGNGETPLLLATWKTQKERALIVEKLLSKLPKDSIDDTCDLAENNTPLMCAIANLDVECVRQLVKAGAKLHIKNDDGFNAIKVAENTGKRWVINALYPKKEQSDLARLASNVITFGLHVVSWVNKRYDGFVSKVFGLQGKRHKSVEKTLGAAKPDREEPTPQEFIEQVDTYVKDMDVLNVFFKDNKEFIQGMAKNLVDLANDTTTDLGNPEVLPKTIKVSLHQQVIYCDDSGSMVNTSGKREQRWENQKALVGHIARITTRILPDGEGVALRFINNKATDDSTSLGLEGIEKALNSVSPAGDTHIGEMLQDRILKPLVYDPLGRKALRRPLLVSILTDGAPDGEPKDTLAKAIVACGDELERREYPRDCVKFLICQIGSSGAATAFLETLRDNQNIASVSHIFAGRFDDKYKSLRDGRALDRWLVETLYEPLAAAKVKNEE